MPFEEHQLFVSPKDDKYKLWRYIDFTKFVSLLNKKAIFFPKARVLKYIDKWEGVWLQKALDYAYDDMLKYFIEKGDENPISRINQFMKDINAGNEHSLDTVFISCWHLNKVESAAMWRLYIKSHEGVAIETNIPSFKKSFADYKRHVLIGKVIYKDYFKDIYYDGDDIGDGGWNTFLPYIHKRNNFEYEQEYRAIVWVHGKDFFEEQTDEGIFVPVNLDILINKIYVSPSCPDWYFNLVKDTLKQFNINKEVLRSEMDDETCKFKNSD
jgi:hypothetical protein